MILNITGIILSVIAICLFFWLKKDHRMDSDLHEAEINHTHKGMNAMMNDFNNYQVEVDRKIAKLEKDLEIHVNGTGREISKMKKDLPNAIRSVIGHIEFAKPLDNTFTPKYKK